MPEMVEGFEVVFFNSVLGTCGSGINQMGISREREFLHFEMIEVTVE